jgi:1-acyl-sn-glycerol-3-phosphate acyltransferase
LLLFYPAPRRRAQAARTLVRRFFGAFIALMKGLGILTYELKGFEALRRPGLLILSNHPTLIDAVFLMAHIPDATCVVKANLSRNPFTRFPVAAAGYITNDSGPAMVEACRGALQAGQSLLIFPEGTRTPLEGPMTLRRGAANVAIRCLSPVTPVVITCTPRALAKGQKWYIVPARPMHLVLRVFDDFPITEFLTEGAPEPIAVRRLDAELRSFFERESRGAAS